MERSPKRKRSRSKGRGKIKVKVQVEETKPENSPIVVSFPGGLPESLQSSKSESSSLQFTWQRLNDRSKLGRRVIGKDKNCLYNAQSQGLSYDDRRTKLCIGVYNKKTGVVEIREAASRGTVYALQQNVPAYLDKNGVVKAEPGKGMLTYDTSLYDDFGSSKKRKVLKSQAANRVDIDHVVGGGEGSAVMHQVMNGKSMSESNREALKQAKEDGDYENDAIQASLEAARRDFLPKYDVDAVKPDKVYSAKDIAGDRAWSRVYNKVFACMHKDDVSQEIIQSVFEKDWSNCTLKLAEEIAPEGKSSGYRYTCTILLNWLIKFYHGNQSRRVMPAPDEGKSTYFGIPVEVAMRWIDLFATAFADDKGGTSYSMSKGDKDRCIVYALLLYMMAHGPTMKVPDLKQIANDLKVTVNDSCNMLRLAGCSIAKKGAKYTAVLKTPLTFPPPPRGARRGR